VKSEELIEITNQFACVLNNFEKEYEVLFNEQSEVDKQQQDILHRIEEVDLNASQGYKVYRQLKTVRQRRRKIKNEISAFTSFRDTFYKNNRGMGINLFTTTKKMKESGGWQPNEGSN